MAVIGGGVHRRPYARHPVHHLPPAGSRRWCRCSTLWVGLIKAPVFGLIVALAGCYQGMQVRGNSEEVGLRTTKAVVQAIFMVIVLDAFFAIFFDQISWA